MTYPTLVKVSKEQEQKPVTFTFKVGAVQNTEDLEAVFDQYADLYAAAQASLADPETEPEGCEDCDCVSQEEFIIADVLARSNTFAEEITSTLYGMGINSDHPTFAGLFTTMYQNCENAYRDQIYALERQVDSFKGITAL